MRTFNAAGADPDYVIAGGVVGGRHVVDHWVDDSLLATHVQPTDHRRVALLQTLDDDDCWIVLVFHAE